jgi:hypothetical protein
MFTAAKTFEILIPLTLHPALFSRPIFVPEKVGVNQKDVIKKKIPISNKGLA